MPKPPSDLKSSGVDALGKGEPASSTSSENIPVEPPPQHTPLAAKPAEAMAHLLSARKTLQDEMKEAAKLSMAEKRAARELAGQPPDGATSTIAPPSASAAAEFLGQPPHCEVSGRQSRLKRHPDAAPEEVGCLVPIALGPICPWNSLRKQLRCELL